MGECLRRYLADNMFDGSDAGRLTWDIGPLLDEIVENVSEWDAKQISVDERADLIERLETAAQRLDEDEHVLHPILTEMRAHLRGKAEGVRLALSYIKEGGK